MPFLENVNDKNGTPAQAKEQKPLLRIQA